MTKLANCFTALDFGITTGRQEAKYPCAFVFNSNETRNGTFASPNYPGLYPRDTECHYFFNGQPNERVHLHFHFFDVEGVLPCEALTASDFVEFSNYMAKDRKYSRHCGQMKEFDVDSDRKFFRVTFKSNDRLDGTGFNASYVFLDEEENYTVKAPTNEAILIRLMLVMRTMKSIRVLSVGNDETWRGICFRDEVPRYSCSLQVVFSLAIPRLNHDRQLLVEGFWLNLQRTKNMERSRAISKSVRILNRSTTKLRASSSTRPSTTSQTLRSVSSHRRMCLLLLRLFASMELPKG
ncbi:suppressor of lurcher protein 1 isoform X1 [Vespula maculifrons]|uniref:Suppressor of lurcher protein 1 isoform X1 n=1 Tax=Vespula maculifrons TaxID=7453 RepID=A0ABD2BZS3_VESMC